LILGAVGSSAYARSAMAQQGTPPPVWCAPGTSLCVQGSGQGSGGAGATVGGGAAGQVGPGGAQGQAQGNAGANANAQGQAQGNAGANANAQGQGQAPGSGGASGHGQSTGKVLRHEPQSTPPPPSSSPPDETMIHRSTYTGPPLALGASPCLVGRIGIWSGVHGGACFGFGLRAYNGVGFELDFIVLGGGTLPTLDLLLRPTLVVPLAGRTPYFDQLSLKIGSTIVGGSIPLEGSVSYVRFGGSIGLGYDVALSDSLDWRVLDTSFYAEVRVGSHRAAYMDHLGNSWDLGLMLLSGLLFH
jgi:hypothetical protein